ncbi:MAG TPA: hypothetical protein VF516_13710 [Kofleriaceae bacterium]
MKYGGFAFCFHIGEDQSRELLDRDVVLLFVGEHAEAHPAEGLSSRVPTQARVVQSPSLQATTSMARREPGPSWSPSSPPPRPAVLLRGRQHRRAGRGSRRPQRAARAPGTVPGNLARPPAQPGTRATAASTAALAKRIAENQRSGVRLAAMAKVATSAAKRSKLKKTERCRKRPAGKGVFQTAAMVGGIVSGVRSVKELAYWVKDLIAKPKPKRRGKSGVAKPKKPTKKFTARATKKPVRGRAH